MNAPAARICHRRDFLAAAARSAMLLTFALFAAWQQGKRRRLANDPNCIKLSVCSECVEFRRCTKPKAQTVRATVARAA